MIVLSNCRKCFQPIKAKFLGWKEHYRGYLCFDCKRSNNQHLKDLENLRAKKVEPIFHQGSVENDFKGQSN